MAVVTLITLLARRGRTPSRDDARAAIAGGATPSHIDGMDAPRPRPFRKAHPLLRQMLFLAGILLIIVSPLVGAIPGPGGVVVFAAGLALILKNSNWAKRQYVRFKRRHPNKGRWADWGMRRPSARRRETMHRAFAAGSVVEAGREEALPSPAVPAGSASRSGEE